MCLSLHETYSSVYCELNEKGITITYSDIQWLYAGIGIAKTIFYLQEQMMWLSEIKLALHDSESHFRILRQSYELLVTSSSEYWL
jgi:hypothetical protein